MYYLFIFQYCVITTLIFICIQTLVITPYWICITSVITLLPSKYGIVLKTTTLTWY